MGDTGMDLDAARRARIAKRGGPEPLVLGGATICTLPAEFPLDVLEPLISGVNVDIALLVRTMLDAAAAEQDQSLTALGSMVVDMVVVNPHLPAELLTAVKEMGRRLFGQGGYDAFVAARPSREDIAELVKGLFAKYGWGSAGDVLGESKRPEVGSADGTISTPTSGVTSTDSTSTESGLIPQIPASSDYGASSPTAIGFPATPS